MSHHAAIFLKFSCDDDLQISRRRGCNTDWTHSNFRGSRRISFRGLEFDFDLALCLIRSERRFSSFFSEDGFAFSTGRFKTIDKAASIISIRCAEPPATRPRPSFFYFYSQIIIWILNLNLESWIFWILRSLPKGERDVSSYRTGGFFHKCRFAGVIHSSGRAKIAAGESINFDQFCLLLLLVVKIAFCHF